MPEKGQKLKRSLKANFESLNQIDISRIFHVSRRTLIDWTSNGCPRNKDLTYSIYEVHNWLLLRDSNKDTDNLSNEKVQKQIELMEIKIKEQSGNSLGRGLVESVMADQAREFKGYWMNHLPSKAPQLAKALGLGGPKVAKLRDVLISEVKGSMTAFIGAAKTLVWEKVDNDV